MRRGLIVIAALALAGSALAASPRAHVGLRSTSLGSILVDARGHTLYAFDLDQGTKSACKGVCLASWRPFLTTGKPLATGVPAGKVGMAKQANGSFQVTFAGHLLYFFAGDTKAGQVRGASIAHWAALSKTGAKVKPAASSAPPPTTTAPYGGGGYDTGGGYY